MAQLTVQQAFDLALQHHRAGRLPEAEKLYRNILATDAKHAGAMHFLGVLANQVGRSDIAVGLIHDAIALGLDGPEVQVNYGNALAGARRIDEAIAAYRRAMELQPDYADAFSNLGNALQEKGLLDEAIEMLRRAILLRPDYPEAHSNLGIALKNKGDLDGAIASYHRAIEVRAEFPEAYCSLGNALTARGKLDEAVSACRRAIELRPGYAEAYNNLGNALREKGRMDEAIAAYRQAIVLKPGYADAFSNLGSVLTETGRLDEAVGVLRQAVALAPGYCSACSNLSIALAEKGQVNEAIGVLRHALALEPDNAVIHSNLLFSLHNRTDSDAQMMAEEHQQWNRRHAEPLARFIRPHTNDRAPDRRLRIGYVSPDFNDHVLARYLLPLFSTHDRRQFEITAYAHVPNPDAVTRDFQRSVDCWRQINGLSDERVAELIRADQIDILIDLTGHTATNRLLVFARKPAPVQVTFLGYPDTTGLTTIDYRITDAHADPPGTTEAFHSEQLVRLPQTAWLYRPKDDGPDVDHHPEVERITFGCFNNFAKVTDDMLRLWARILLAVPQSRLLIKARALGEPDGLQRVRSVFANSGVPSDRLDLVDRVPDSAGHLALYNRVSIGLDPFPYHGTTTTLEALWMGVPVVTLAGQTHVSRVGVSLLSNVGLADLVANTPDEYVAVAVRLANHLPRLRELHLTLRDRLKQSPLMDEAGFTRNLENAYRQMWKTWCERGS